MASHPLNADQSIGVPAPTPYAPKLPVMLPPAAQILKLAVLWFVKHRFEKLFSPLQLMGCPIELLYGLSTAVGLPQDAGPTKVKVKSLLN